MHWIGLCCLFFCPQTTLFFCPQAAEGGPPEDPPLEKADLAGAARVAGLDLTAEEIEQMLPGVIENLQGYTLSRGRDLDNAVAPALTFSPLLPGVTARADALDGDPTPLPEAERPADLAELAFADIPTLASLVKSRKVSCEELAQLYLGRLRTLDEKLLFVTELTEERALERARALDAELADGKWRGPLHGIPYGVKDLLAVRGTRTTWGAAPFREQRIETDATVVERLDAAGAVLVAKLTLGALAMGDVWYGGKTRNPWAPDRGSGGSSAGSASAVAAGALPFAIGSETLGSITSPARRCGNSALRPTFGRVSRHGAMALSWTMDKLGPFCRTLHDTALVLDVIDGPDGKDPTVIDLPFGVPPTTDVRGWKVGVPKGAFDEAERYRTVLDELEALGVEMVEIELPDYPVWEMMVILHAEAAASFDELTRSDRDDELTRQTPDAWPNLFRVARLIPAVEYIRANRLRTLLALDMHSALEGVDALVAPGPHGPTLGITNLTGHPCLVAPCGFREDGRPYSAVFVGHLFGEERLVALGRAWQESTEYHRRHPGEESPSTGK